MPQRKAPSERLQRAAAEAAGVELPDEDEDALRFSIRPDAWAWEKWLARFLQVRCMAGNRGGERWMMLGVAGWQVDVWLCQLDQGLGEVAGEGPADAS
jgi:hypothetical protein